MRWVSGDASALQSAWYLAGPFFNHAQLALIQRLERAFEDHQIECFSPRLQHGEKPTPIETANQAQQVFAENARALKACRGVVAVVDWTTVGSVCIRAGIDRADGTFETVRGEPINLPDTGTVWEMGVAYAYNRPVVMYTERPVHAKLNIMLTQSCLGVARSEKQLMEFLTNEQARTLDTWKGAYT